MTKRNVGFLILDRKGEYIQNTIDQRGNTVFGLQNHPNAGERMVIISARSDPFEKMKKDGLVVEWLKPQFNISDIDPIDLADFMLGLTDVQSNLVRDYAYITGFYEKILAETRFGAVDKRQWYENFPGLFDLSDKGKKYLKEFEEEAAKEERDFLKDEERDKLQSELKGTKSDVLERAASRIKRFCLNPFFGGIAKGSQILNAPSCVEQILHFLEKGMFVFIDMRGQSDDSYTLIAALFARRLLNENKKREDKDQIKACIVMEEAHNIINDESLTKGNGTGSVFIELAREGRSFKLGFVLVTQQPDARSIAPQVVKTIDTVVAFNMPPEDAKHLQRLKSAFESLEKQISNAPEFRGVAVSNSGPIFFKSVPVNKDFMEHCANGTLEPMLKSMGEGELQEIKPNQYETVITLSSKEDWLEKLMRQRQENIQSIALANIREWRSGYKGYDDPEQNEG